MSKLLDLLLTPEQRREAAIAHYIRVRDNHPYHAARRNGASRSQLSDQAAEVAKRKAWLKSLPTLSQEQRAEILADKFAAVLENIRVEEAVERDNERARRDTGLDA